MAMILDAFVSNFMSILTSMAKDEVGQLLGIPGEIKKLTDMVYRVQGVLVDAERRQNESEAINRWVKQLKDVMYDADDVIDLCHLKVDERRARSGSSSYSKTSCGIDFLSCFRNPCFARKIADQIKELNSRIKELVGQISLLGLIESRVASSEDRQMAFNISRDTHPVVVASDLVGEKIEEDAEQLVEVLTRDVDRGQGNIPIVVIEGMGGIGKTTLAKKVYNDPKIQEDFEHRIWVCVSKEIKCVDVLKNVIRSVGGGYGAAEDISELVLMLEKYIAGKKFFLILDDVWPESEGVWDNLLSDPMIKGAPGSRVLITTRDGRLAMRTRAIHTLKVNKLSDEDGWCLLLKKVAPNGRFESEIQNLKDIGMQIVRKCDGLPIAIKSISGLLCTKGFTRGNWEAILRNDMWSNDGLPRDVHHAFYLSYEDLPPPLKQCFIFCSLFPEDYKFHKMDLINYWLAEGFLQDNKDFWELGNEYYMELLLRNLLEVTGERVEHVECKMHDLLWSFARQLGKDENYILREGQDLSKSESSLKVRRLLIEGDEVNTEVIKVEKGLRTLVIYLKSKIILDNMDRTFSNLRIFDLRGSNISSIPDYLGNLVHLRYLDVSQTKITNLPNSIGNLKYLMFLGLAHCKDLSHVPHSIINLQRLKYLNAYNSGVQAIPTGLDKLQNLITLLGFKPDKNSIDGFSSLDGIGTLSLLTNLLLEGLEKVSDENLAKRANLQNKHRLQKLDLAYTSLSWEEQVSKTDEQKVPTEGVLNDLCPPVSLEILYIVNYFGNYLPKWLNLEATLPNLRFLEIINCACINGLSPLGLFHNLEWLQIKSVYSVVSVGEEFLSGDTQRRDTLATSCSAFPKLTCLGFENMPNWKNWQWNMGQPAMPILKKLFIRDCPQLASLPEGLLLYATSLEVLRIEGANNPSTIENLSSIKEIRVIRNIILERISNLDNISHIYIEECPNLKAVENVKALHTIELIDYEMENLPNYLTMTTLKRLIIRGSEKLLLKIVSEGATGSEAQKFTHIPTVKIYSPGKSSYAAYQKTPFTFATNIRTSGWSLVNPPNYLESTMGDPGFEPTTSYTEDFVFTASVVRTEQGRGEPTGSLSRGRQFRRFRSRMPAAPIDNALIPDLGQGLEHGQEQMQDQDRRSLSQLPIPVISLDEE